MFHGLERVTEHYEVFVFSPPTHSSFHFWIRWIYAKWCQAVNHQVISYASLTWDAQHASWLEAEQTLEDWFSEYLAINCQIHACPVTSHHHIRKSQTKLVESRANNMEWNGTSNNFDRKFASISFPKYWSPATCSKNSVSNLFSMNMDLKWEQIL